MRAIAYQTPQAITAQTALVDIELPVPEPGGRDLLVEIKAVSVNPVDTKQRAPRAHVSSATPDPSGWCAERRPSKTPWCPGQSV